MFRTRFSFLGNGNIGTGNTFTLATFRNVPHKILILGLELSEDCPLATPTLVTDIGNNGNNGNIYQELDKAPQKPSIKLTKIAHISHFSKLSNPKLQT